MIGTGHQQQMLHLTILKFIHQGGEIPKSVLGAVIEFNPLDFQPLVLD
tara:strand:- start:76 stop:219 length:144 start_codon:yes stop_codon:yes gene_type:complete